MMPKEAGAVQEQIELAPNWHLSLEKHQLAAYIRYQYIRHFDNEWDWDGSAHSRRRVTWDGGKDRFGVKHTCIWTKIADLVLAERAHPGVWVAAHFSDISRNAIIAQTHSLPEVRPTTLRTSQSPATYAKYCEEFPKMLRQAYQVAGDTIANRLRGTLSLKLAPDDQAFYVLCDEAYVSASSFFRYVFAEQLGCQRGVERYLWLAALEYEAQQALFDVALRHEPQCFTEPLKAALYEIRKHWREFT